MISANLLEEHHFYSEGIKTPIFYADLRPKLENLSGGNSEESWDRLAKSSALKYKNYYVEDKKRI